MVKDHPTSPPPPHHRPQDENVAASDNIIRSWRRVFYEVLSAHAWASPPHPEIIVASVIFFHLAHFVRVLLSVFASLGTHGCRI